MGAAEEHKSVQIHDQEAAAVLCGHLLMCDRGIDAAAIKAAIHDLPHQQNGGGIDGNSQARADDADRNARQEDLTEDCAVANRDLFRLETQPGGEVTAFGERIAALGRGHHPLEIIGRCRERYQRSYLASCPPTAVISSDND